MNEEQNQDQEQKPCDRKTEVYSRVVGFFRPVDHFNKGMAAQYKDRKEYNIQKNFKIKRELNE